MAPAQAPPQLITSLSTVLPYFAESPFFDATSNNATLTTQAFFNPNMFYIIQTREAFEGRLRTMQGLEFMVTHDPSENDTKPGHNGVWVIRKQNRRKRQGAQDEITGISSYYVVGENVYMAPSVGNILGSRLVCASVLLLLGRADLEASALHSHFPHKTTFHRVLPSQLYSFARSYLPPSGSEESYYRFRPSGKSGEQGGHTDARRRHAVASITRDCYQREGFQNHFGLGLPRRPNAGVFLRSS